MPQHVCRHLRGTAAEDHRSRDSRAGRASRWLHAAATRSTTAATAPRYANDAADAPITTLGWSDCGHDDYRRGIVLDPFAGSGTTLAAATEQGRDATGIDLDPRNYWLARERIGMFLAEPA